MRVFPHLIFHLIHIIKHSFYLRAVFLQALVKACVLGLLIVSTFNDRILLGPFEGSYLNSQYVMFWVNLVHVYV